MDLLGPIFAYLGAVTAIIVGALMSYEALIQIPLHSTNPQHTLTIAATPRAAKAALPASTGKIAAPRVPVASVSHNAAAKAASQIAAAADRRAAAHLRREAYLRRAARREHMRLLAQQARARQWASRRASRQAPAVLGYADEPHAGPDYDFYQGFYQ